MPIQLQLGLEAITSYKRLSYSPWHAIAEFVDNSTQAYFNNKEALDDVYAEEGEGLHVRISYDREDTGILRISDNSIGMSKEELEHALHIGEPPRDTSGRSKYGMGLKTAACWIGNKWTVRTKKLGETSEHYIEVDVDRVARGDSDLRHRDVQSKPSEMHYTIIEITDLNRKFHGRTLGKIRTFLSSMYREDFRHRVLALEWQGVALTWEELDDQLLVAANGKKYKKEFAFLVDSKAVRGWVGILGRGSRASAGFSIIYCGRVVRGWPDSWRPSSLYGQLQGSNDLVNQRLVGEIHLDEFIVSHTKDDILWLGSQEEDVEALLLEHCGDYREAAKDHRKGDIDERGPSEMETQVAVDELKRELSSPEIVDLVLIQDVPEEDVVDRSLSELTDRVVESQEETLSARIADFNVRIYLVSDMSPNDPYVAVDSTRDDEVLIVINVSHPHFCGLKGSEGVLNYLRHCTYDGVAELQARRKAARLDPNTIKLLKDQLLRVPFVIADHAVHYNEAEDQ